MDGKDLQGYMSGEFPVDDGDDLFMPPLGPSPTPSYHHHHHHQGQGAGVDPISPMLGGYSAMPPQPPPRLQHSPPFLSGDTNPQQFYTEMPSGGGSTCTSVSVSGWSQYWQPQDTTATAVMMSSSESQATDSNFLPILPELHHQQQQLQYQSPHQHQHHQNQAQLPYHPPQQQMGVPPSLHGANTVVDPVRQGVHVHVGPGREENQVIPVTCSTPTNHRHQLNSQSGEGRTTSCNISPSCSEVPAQPPVLGSHANAQSTADYQSVPNSEESSTRSSLGSESSAATVDESSGDGVFSLTNSKVTEIRPPGQSESIYIPSLDVFPGDYGFKVTFKNPDSSAYSYSPDSKVLCVNKKTDFAAIFSFSERPRPGFTIRTLVCPKTSQDIKKVGIVRRCASHLHGDKGSNFLVCRSDSAVYSECHSHSIISVPLDTMAEYDLDGPTCVYSCACYSTCVVGKGANRPTLVIIFSLLDDTKGSIVGQDVINLRCCACPNRDSGRSRKRGTNLRTANPVKKKRKTKKSRRTESPPLPPTAGPADSSPLALLPPLSSLPAQLNRVQDAQPDEDGFYTFTWRTKDKALLNWLTLMKEGHMSDK